MSRTVTETCPICGTTGVLILQETYGLGDTEPSRTDPERFDCPNGCQLELDELLEAFRKYR